MSQRLRDTQAYRWMSTRKADAVALALVWATLLQLAIGVALVKGVRGQSQELLNDRIMQRQQTLDQRITAVEQMNLPVRIAVLERSADDVAEVRKLVYGVLATLIGSLFAQIVQIRGQRRLRRPEDDAP